MKTYILYISNEKLTPDHRRVFVSGQSLDSVWIRAEVINGELSDGLDQAKPRKGETVLNSWSPYLEHSTDQKGVND